MGSLLMQTWAVIRMNISSLPSRVWMSLAMILASAVVVAILLAFLSMAKGFEATVGSAGADDVAMFMRQGSAAELNSTVTREQVNIIETAPGLMLENGNAVMSPELYVIVDGIKKTSQTEANIPLRGLSQQGMTLREGFELREGRMFTPGTDEMIVGVGILDQFSGFELGSTVKFGKYQWKVVGVFSAGGNIFESELWADAKVIQNLYNRGSSFQSVRAKMTSADQLEQIKTFVADDPRLNLDVQSEVEYFSSQSKGLSYIALFGRVVSFVMALGALAGALNTMYSSVADRAQEIATLRALGFSNFSAFVGTIAEALALAAIGGVVGACAAYLLFDGLSASTLGGSFTQVVFNFKLTGELIGQGINMALLIGFISGVFPAWRAARMPVIKAFQSAH